MGPPKKSGSGAVAGLLKKEPYIKQVKMTPAESVTKVLAGRGGQATPPQKRLKRVSNVTRLSPGPPRSVQQRMREAID